MMPRASHQRSRVIRDRTTPPFVLIVLLLAVFLPFPAGALRGQTPGQPEDSVPCASFRPGIATLADAGADYLRGAEIEGRSPPRSLAFRTVRSERGALVCGGPPFRARFDQAAIRNAGRGRISLDAAPVRSGSTYNTAYPADRNNGARWDGRGVSAEVSAGGALRAGRLTLALEPIVAFQQNRAFEIVDVEAAGYSPFVYPWHDRYIDWPQRFGTGSFFTFDPGQSYVRADVGRVGGGVSTENLWWGPGAWTSLVLGNTGPGFLHAFLETTSPVGSPVGRFTGQLVWGFLEESDYFDLDPANDRRFLSGAVLAYQLPRSDALTVGFASVREFSLEGRSVRPSMLLEPLGLPFTPSADENQRSTNGLGSVFFRVVLPASAFEMYGELAREDFFLDLRDLLGEPGHSLGYLFGLRKSAQAWGHRIQVSTEIVDVGLVESTLTGRTRPVFYAHAGVRQGHTHKGQLLGSFVGPGSDAQLVAVDLFADTYRIGGFLSRVRWDDDAYVIYRAANYGLHGHDVEVAGGGRASLTLGAFDVDAGVSVSRRRNRSFIGLDGVRWAFATDTNVTLSLAAAWWPGG